MLILFVRINSNHRLVFNNIRMMSLHANILIRLVLLGKWIGILLGEKKRGVEASQGDFAS